MNPQKVILKKSPNEKFKNTMDKIENSPQTFDEQVKEKESKERKDQAPKELMNLFEKSKLFWKIARPKFAVVNYLCPRCRKLNYKHPDQFKVINGEFHFTQVMCKECLQYNMIHTDIYIKHTKNPH